MGIYRKQIWKNSEENSEKINRGDPFLKNLPWGTKGKNLKKNFEKKYIFIKSFGIYGLYSKNFFGKFWNKEFWKKKFEKKNLRFFPLVPPYLKKPTWGGPKEKIWKKKFEKKYIFIKSFGIYGLYNRNFFGKKLKKKILKKKSQICSFGTPLPEKTYLGGLKEKIWKKKFEKKIYFY